MLIHDPNFFSIQGPGLFQDCNRNRGLAYIVNKCPKRQLLPIRARKAQVLAECYGNARNQKAMLVGQAMMLLHGTNPSDNAIFLDMRDNSITCCVHHFHIQWSTYGNRGKQVLQDTDPGHDPLGVSN